MYFAVRRQYGAPNLYTVGGGRCEGMDASDRWDAPATRARLAENLWRESGGEMAKRGGFRVVTAAETEGEVLWQCSTDKSKYLVYRNGEDYFLRRNYGIYTKEIPWGKGGYLKWKDGILLYTPGKLLWIDGEEKAVLVTPRGVADVSADLSAVPTMPEVNQTLLPVPLVRAGTSPTGKGRYVLPPNLLSPLVQESFVYTQTDKEARRNRFCLALSPELQGELPDVAQEQDARRVAVLSASAKLEARLTRADDYGNTVDFWQEISWEAEDNINSKDSAFWIQSIPDNLCYDGDDNLRITYYRSTAEAEKQCAEVLGCKCFTAYGVGGMKDRVFAGGGGRIYYSGMDEPLYFGALHYFDVGGDGEIQMMAGEDTVMTVLCTDGARRIEGKAEYSTSGEYALDAAFSVSAVLPAPRAVSPRHVTAGGELLYISDEGICAVTPSGVLDERCVQVRSARLNGLLLREDPEDLRLHTAGDYLFVGGKKGMYLFDLQHRVKVSENAYSSHSYEGYYWSGTRVDCFAEGEGVRFYSDGTLYELCPGVYHDEVYQEGEIIQKPISAVWETVRLQDLSPFACRVCALKVLFPTRAGLRIEYSRGGPWKMLRDYSGDTYGFGYQPLHYGLWNYGTSGGEGVKYTVNLRNVKHLRLRFSNDLADQDFRLQTYCAEYK